MGIVIDVYLDWWLSCLVGGLVGCLDIGGSVNLGDLVFGFGGCFDFGCTCVWFVFGWWLFDLLPVLFVWCLRGGFVVWV